MYEYASKNSELVVVCGLTGFLPGNSARASRIRSVRESVFPESEKRGHKRKVEKEFCSLNPSNQVKFINTIDLCSQFDIHIYTIIHSSRS